MNIDRTIAPPIQHAVDFEYNLQPIQTALLDNGLPVHWLSAGVQEVVSIDWVFPAGLWFEPKPMVSDAVAALLKNGTARHSAQEINESLEFFGATLRATAGDDFGTVSLYCLSRHLPRLLPMVFELLTESTFPETELAIFKQNAIQRFLVNDRQCEFVANQIIEAQLFGPSHPYGRFLKKEKFEALMRDDLVAFYKQHYGLANARIFLSGKVGAQEIGWLNEVFGRATLAPVSVSQVSFAPFAPTERKEFVLNDENGVQAAIRIARQFPTRHHPDFAPMVVLNTLFGGYFGSRLMSNIREEKGYTYGIYSSLSPMIHAGSLTIHTEVGRDVLEPAAAEIYREMERLRQEPVDPSELQLVKNYLLGNLLGDLDGPFQIMQRWRTLLLYGQTGAHFDENVRIYKSITPDTLHELAHRYLNPDDFLEVWVI